VTAERRAGASRGAVLVTGASTGIGAHLARALLDEGYVVVATVRDPDDGRDLELAGAIVPLLDVTDDDSIRSARDVVRDALGGTPLRGVVNNAGVGGFGPLELLSTQEIRDVFEVNAFGAVAVTRAFLPDLRASCGRIVMISSISGRVAAPFLGPYAASKFALEGFADSLRRELLPHGVRVTVVQPGPIATDIWAKMRRRGAERFEQSVYAPFIERFAELVGESAQRARDPELVSRAVLRALTASRPPARVLVVRSALWMRLVSALPDRVVDRLMASRMKP
jgi:NAD(P)-dependent dehydrogenase (short-subunit alcohol dehydrogenase family)